MIADKVIKKEFTAKVLREDAQLITSEQLSTVRDFALLDSGSLQNSIQSAANVDNSAIGTRLRFTFVKHIRFLDMKNTVRKRKSFVLYNKIIFGIIYNRTVARLMFGYSDSIRKAIRNELQIKKIDIDG